MAQGKRAEVFEAQRTDIWQRWKVGQSLHQIGRAYGRTPSSIHLLLSHHGGIVPVVRRRSPQALKLTEREDISRGIASGSSMREIAASLRRAASTVSREVARHGGRSECRASDADSEAWESARRPKLCLLAIHEPLREIVISKLMLDWSPEQVSGWLKIQYPKDENLRVSYETIYRSLFIQARGVLKKELIGHLRSKRRIRRSQHSSKSGHAKGQIVEAISIRERPAEIEDRAIPGHWEGDLIGGTKNSHIVTLVERHSRFTTLIKVPHSLANPMAAALLVASGGLPVAHIRTMEEIVVLNTSRQRFNMLMLTIFGASALLMAAIGIYGLMAYSVQQRTQEMGIRMALGAQAPHIRNMVIRQGMVLALIGVVIGIAGAFGMTRFLASFLFDVKAWDPLAFIVTPVLLSTVALLAVWVPAQRAVRVDPMSALRFE